MGCGAKASKFEVDTPPTIVRKRWPLTVAPGQVVTECSSDICLKDSWLHLEPQRKDKKMPGRKDAKCQQGLVERCEDVHNQKTCRGE